MLTNRNQVIDGRLSPANNGNWPNNQLIVAGLLPSSLPSSGAAAAVVPVTRQDQPPEHESRPPTLS